MPVDNAPYRFTAEQLRAMPTLRPSLDNKELKVEELGADDRGVRVWLVEDDGNPNPYRVTGHIERRHGLLEDGPSWHDSEYYNAEDPTQHQPGPFAHQFE